jgi:hypothetical protein
MPQLAQRIRAKYPGAYDDIDDATLEKQVLAKHPEYADLAQPEPQKPAQSPKPSVTTQQLAAQGPSAMSATKGQAFKSTLKMAGEHPGQTGALLAGAAAAPFTGGLSVPAAMGVEAAVGAGGAGAGHLVKSAATQQAPDVVRMLTDMATQGAIGAGGPLAGGALRMVGRGLYRTALAPTQQVLGKYGDVVGEGLATRTPVSREGLAKATESKITRIATKKNALADADQRVMFRSDAIADDAAKPLSEYATKQVRAGLPDPTGEIGDRLAQFKAVNPNGSLTPSSLDEIKRTLDDTTGLAYRKMRTREPLTPTEKTSTEMTRAMSRANESAVPEYRQMNRGIMDAEGLRRAVERRTLGSGGNQVLDTLLALVRGSAGIPGRVAMMPPVMSKAGIGAHVAGEHTAQLPTTIRALMALLSGSPDTP